MKKSLMVLAILLVSLPALAQEVEQDQTSVQPVPVKEGKKFTWKAKLLDASLRSMAIIDLKSTYDVQDRCLGGCKESNPHARWFVEKGPQVSYPATMLFDTGITYLSYQMRKSWNPFIRKIWFVPSLAIAILHGMAAYHNYHLPWDPRLKTVK